MLKAIDIKKSFDGLGVLDGISVEIQKGEVVALIGPSGSGKSTFLRCVNRLETIDSGEISLDGDRMCWMEGGKLREADEKTLQSIRRRMGMVFQSFNLFPHMSVMKNLTDAPVSVLKLPLEEAEARAMALLQKVGLADKAKAYPHQLSGGQRQALALLIATMTPIELLILDEHTAALDPKSSETVMQLTERIIRDRGLTALMVTHNLKHAIRYGNRILMMHQGGVVLDAADEDKEARSVDDLLKIFTEISVELGN